MRKFGINTKRNILALLTCGAVARLIGATPTSPYFVTDATTGKSASEFVRVSTDAAESIKVSQKNKSFEPAALDIKVGQAITFINDDTTPHNVYCSEEGFKYNSGPQKPGEKSNLAFTAPGTYQVRCLIHPKMLLTVKVSE